MPSQIDYYISVLSSHMTSPLYQLIRGICLQWEFYIVGHLGSTDIFAMIIQIWGLWPWRSRASPSSSAYDVRCYVYSWIFSQFWSCVIIMSKSIFNNLNNRTQLFLNITWYHGLLFHIDVLPRQYSMDRISSKVKYKSTSPFQAPWFVSAYDPSTQKQGIGHHYSLPETSIDLVITHNIN